MKNDGTRWTEPGKGYERPNCANCGKQLFGRDLLYAINREPHCAACYYPAVEKRIEQAKVGR